MHHLYYEKDQDPWDYPDESLITLCEECHQEEKEGKYEAEGDLIYALRVRGYTNADIDDIYNGILNCPYTPHTRTMFSDLVLLILIHKPALDFLYSEMGKNMDGKSSIFTE